MGNTSSVDTKIVENPNREVFVSFDNHKCVKSRLMGTYVVFTFIIRYQKYKWEITLRFNELVALDRKLLNEHVADVGALPRPAKQSKMFWTHDEKFLLTRANVMMKYLQDICDRKILFDTSKLLRTSLNISRISFNPDFGKKGKEGFLIKCSGGYIEKFSRKTGDYFNVWTWRYFVLTDNAIAWYASPDDKVPKGTLQVDQNFRFVVVDRVISIYTATRKLVVQAWTKRTADEWVAELKRVYVGALKTSPQHFQSSFPPRLGSEVKVYTYSRDYMSAAAVAMLGAQREILITSWKNSPGVLLTRAPLPPLRLDQILKHKADQGVQVHILLYKEVEYVGQGNDSGRTKAHLESLSPNIHVIRHPNKFVGGSTAVMWSHHEKTLVIDRNMAFVGGIDFAYQRWDDELHRVADEDGVLFPGHDYRQPAPGLFKPVRVEQERTPGSGDGDEDDDEVEVEIAVPGEALPFAASAAVGADDDEEEPYEVEVVVDFGVQSSVVSPTSVADCRDGGHSADSSSQQKRGVNPSSASSGGDSMPLPPPPGHDLFGDGDLEARLSGGGGDNWAEDRYEEESPAERQAKQAAECDEEECAADDYRSMAASDMLRSTVSTVSEGITQVRSTLSQTLGYFSTQLRVYKEQVTSYQRTTRRASDLGARDMYPRMPWHDVQAAFNGAAARDVAAHFVQRWNHHRLSTSNYHEPIMYDITDNMAFGECARCETKNIRETATHCPTCGFGLGATNSYSQPTDPRLVPEDPAALSYLVFDCRYYGALPFRMQGDCPVVVTALLQAAHSNDATAEGSLVDINGPMAEWLSAFGLTPAVGDVVLAVDGHLVTQLNSSQFKRLIKRKRQANKSQAAEEAPFITVTFRRHYLENLHPVDKKFETARQAEDANASGLLTEPILENSVEFAQSATGEQLFAPTFVASDRPTLLEVRCDTPESYFGTAPPSAEYHTESVCVQQETIMTLSAGGNDSTLSTHSTTNQAAVVSSSSSRTGVSSLPQEAALIGDSEAVFGKGVGVSSSEMQAVAAEPMSAPAMLHHPPPAGAENCKNAAQYHPACQAAAHQELRLAMGQLYHLHSRHLDLVSRLADDSGTCKVQVLRSVGKWSVGTKTECSILNCWVESIQGAQRFVYIESQFFIGSNAGDGVANGIPGAIVERILAAHALKETFRVVVVIPVHPNGDYAGAMKSRVVMHYQYQTINRGLNSMFSVLRKRAPGIVISDYIGFFSLRNWGVMNNKVVSDQVYVHDKLMVVDDRVAIIGSANINDRSMVGFRDSEVAIRIEDTFHLDATMDGRPHTVGYLPHTLRLRLMNQHIRDESIDLSDPVKSEVFTRWKYIANHNSAIYDELDGNLSVYRCNTLAEHHSAFANHHNKSYLDPMVRESLSEIKGFLVDWPQNLFQKEDLAPSMATRTLISNELWY